MSESEWIPRLMQEKVFLERKCIALEMANEKLAAELAELKATLSRYETTAENCDMYRKQREGWQLVPVEPTEAIHGEQVREWISIHDKMPKIGERCLIRIPVGRHFEIEGGEYKGEGDWLGAWCSRKGRNQTYKVSHWMYAPSAAAPSKEGV